jgi:hypothetical protein
MNLLNAARRTILVLPFLMLAGTLGLFALVVLNLAQGGRLWFSGLLLVIAALWLTATHRLWRLRRAALAAPSPGERRGKR